MNMVGMSGLSIDGLRVISVRRRENADAFALEDTPQLGYETATLFQMLYRLERCDAIECLVCKGQNAAVGHNHRSRTSFNIPERLARSTRVQFDADNFTRTRLQDWKPVASPASDVQR